MKMNMYMNNIERKSEPLCHFSYSRRIAAGFILREMQVSIWPIIRLLTLSKP